MSGNKSKKKEIDKGQQQQLALTREAMARQQPYVEIGQPAAQSLNAFAGLGTEQQNEAAKEAFRNSLFYDAGQLSYTNELDQIDNALGAQGLMYSSVRPTYKEEAAQRNFSNAFANYLNNSTNLANIGVSATGAQTNLLANQGNSAAQAGYARADAHRSGLDTLQQVANIGSTISKVYNPFG